MHKSSLKGLGAPAVRRVRRACGAGRVIAADLQSLPDEPDSLAAIGRFFEGLP